MWGVTCSDLVRSCWLSLLGGRWVQMCDQPCWLGQMFGMVIVGMLSGNASWQGMVQAHAPVPMQPGWQTGLVCVGLCSVRYAVQACAPACMQLRSPGHAG